MFIVILIIKTKFQKSYKSFNQKVQISSLNNNTFKVLVHNHINKISRHFLLNNNNKYLINSISNKMWTNINNIHIYNNNNCKMIIKIIRTLIINKIISNLTSSSIIFSCSNSINKDNNFKTLSKFHNNKIKIFNLKIRNRCINKISNKWIRISISSNHKIKV